MEMDDPLARSFFHSQGIHLGNQTNFGRIFYSVTLDTLVFAPIFHRLKSWIDAHTLDLYFYGPSSYQKPSSGEPSLKDHLLLLQGLFLLLLTDACI